MPRFVAAAVMLVISLPLVMTLTGAALADAGRGERVFQRCTACHSVADNGPQLPGPNLRGVIGRRAGTLGGFEYSSAMVDAGKTENVMWDRKTLDKYLADPDDVVPGTAMRMNFQLTADDRSDVIDFLESKK